MFLDNDRVIACIMTKLNVNTTDMANNPCDCSSHIIL